MANKHISEDDITLTINAKADKAQQNIRTFSKEIDKLAERNKSLQRQMDSLEVAGKKDTEQWKQRRVEYGKNNTEIRRLKRSIAEETKQLDINALTMAQLRRQARDLQRQLDNTSKAIHPEDWRNLQKQLTEVKGRMNSLTETAKGMKEEFLDSGVMSFFRGSLMLKGAELVGKFAANLHDMTVESVNLAESADGVLHAFEKIDKHSELLEGLRKATKGTVNNLELMKITLQAKDFHIPLEDLGKYLAFAQLKAQQTGQSVDYMVDSIIKGLGRENKLILDNLGLSGAEIDQKKAELGDFMKAVTAIVDKQLAEAGETYVSAADRAKKKITDLENAQLRLGKALLPWREEMTKAFGSFRIGVLDTIAWLLEHKKVAAAATVATIGFGVAMTVLNAQFKAWITQTIVAKGIMVGWSTATTTVKGITLLISAAFATLRGNSMRAAAAMRLFNTACKANVYIAVAAAVIAAGTALYAYVSRNKKATQATADFMALHRKMAEDIRAQNNSLTKSVNDSTAERITKIKSLRKTINDANEAYAKRKEAILELQKIVPGYHATLTGEGRLFAQNTKIIDNYISRLKQAAMAEAAYERIKENQKKILDAQANIEDSKTKIKNVKTNSKRNYGVDLDKMNIQDDGLVRFKDVHRDDDPRLIDEKKLDYAWYPGDNAAQNLQFNQRFIQERTELIYREQSVVDEWSKQNDRLWEIVKKNGGTGQQILNPVFNNKQTGNEGKTEKDIFSNDRKKELDEQEALYNKSLEVLKGNLIKRKITQEEYNAKVLALETINAAKIYSIEQDYTKKAKGLKIKDQQDKDKIVLDQQANEERARRNFQQKELEVTKQYYDALKQFKDAGMTDKQKAEADHQLQLASLEAFYKASLDYARKHGEDEKALTEAYEKAKAEITRKYEKQKADEKFQIRSQAGLVSQQEIFNRELAQLKEKLKKEGVSEEEQQQAVANMTRQFEEDKLRLRQQYGIAMQQELFDAEIAQLKAHLDAKMISEEEYEKAVSNLKRDRWKADFDRYHDLFGNAMKELQNAEMANMEAKYDAEIQAAQGSAEQVEKLEKEKANEKLKIQKKYADVNFAIQASQIIVNTAVSVMKAFSDLGPIAGAISGALISIAGTAQLAVANAERQKVKKMTLQGAGGSSASGARVATGLESGGVFDVEREQDGKTFRATYDPDRRGYIDRPTVLVGEGPVGHSKEWVASNAALENPTVAPVIDIIDRAQRVGDIRTLDMRKLMMQRGFASGGSISAPVSPAQSTAPATSTQPSEINEEFLSLLRELREKGIPAYVALDEFDAQQKIREQSRNIGKK